MDQIVYGVSALQQVKGLGSERGELFLYKVQAPGSCYEITDTLD